MIKKSIKFIYKNIPYKKNIFTIIKNFYKLHPNLYRHLYFNDQISVDIDKKKSFKMMHYGHYIENEVFWSGLYGGWEKESLKTWSKLVVHSNVIFDIGANTGIYSLIAKTLAPESDVYAFEPVDRIYKKLAFNNQLNEYDIECCNIALSDRDGLARIYDPMTEHLYSVTIDKNLNEPNIDVMEVEVEIKKIGSFIKEKDIINIDLMKIDVETHEVEVLRGMESYLERMQPTMLIEILNNDVAKGVMDVIKNIDYRYYYIDENIGLQRKETLESSEGNNYLICKKEVFDLLDLTSCIK